MFFFRYLHTLNQESSIKYFTFVVNCDGTNQLFFVYIFCTDPGMFPNKEKKNTDIEADKGSQLEISKEKKSMKKQNATNAIQLKLNVKNFE